MIGRHHKATIAFLHFHWDVFNLLCHGRMLQLIRCFPVTSSHLEIPGVRGAESADTQSECMNGNSHPVISDRGTCCLLRCLSKRSRPYLWLDETFGCYSPQPQLLVKSQVKMLSYRCGEMPHSCHPLSLTCHPTATAAAKYHDLCG